MILLRSHPRVSNEVASIAESLSAARPSYGYRFLTALHTAQKLHNGLFLSFFADYSNHHVRT